MREYGCIGEVIREVHGTCHEEVASDWTLQCDQELGAGLNSEF